MTDVDISIGNKWTTGRKSNDADDEQHNAALRRRNRKNHKRKNLIYVKTNFLDWKKREKKDV